MAFPTADLSGQMTQVIMAVQQAAHPNAPDKACNRGGRGSKAAMIARMMEDCCWMRFLCRGERVPVP